MLKMLKKVMIALGIVIVWLIFFSLERICVRNLRIDREEIMRYVESHKGVFPPNLSVVGIRHPFCPLCDWALWVRGWREYSTTYRYRKNAKSGEDILLHDVVPHLFTRKIFYIRVDGEIGVIHGVKEPP